MKLRTLLLFGLAFLGVWVFYAFLQSHHNAQILSSQFQLWGTQFKVLNGFLVAMLVAAVMPAAYFSWKYWQLARLLRAEKKARAGEEQVRHDVDAIAKLLDHGHYEALLEQLKDRDDVRAAFLKGKALLYLHRSGEAIGHLRKAFKEGQLTEAGYLLAKAHRSNGQSPVPVLETLIASDPKNAVRAYRLLLEAQDRQAMWPACLETLRHMRRLGLAIDESMEQGLQFELINAETLGAPKKAADKYQHFLKTNPDFIPAQLALGDAYLELDAGEKALNVWEQGYNRTQNPVFLDQLEEFYLRQGRPEDAIQIYREILVREELPVPRYRLAKLYLRLEMLDDSLACLEALRPQFDGVPGFLTELASIHAKRENYEQAYGTLLESPALASTGALGYVCESCGSQTDEWVSRCEQCKQWNQCTAKIATVEVDRTPTAPLYY